MRQVEQPLWLFLVPPLTVHLWPRYSLPSLVVSFPIIDLGCANFDLWVVAAWDIVLKVLSSGLG